MKRLDSKGLMGCVGTALVILSLSACATQKSASIPPTSEKKEKLVPPVQLSKSVPVIQSGIKVSPKPVAPVPQPPKPVAAPLLAAAAPPILFPKIPDDPSIQLYIDYFQYADHEQFRKWLERSHEYLAFIQKTFHDMGIPEDLAYVSLIESGFSTRAYSRTGAAGLWQFMRGTGVKYGLKINWWIDQRRDPILATRSAAQYLRDLHDEFDSWELALAAYNAGEGRVANAVARTGTKDYWRIRKTRAFSSETRNYIPKMIAAMMIAKDPGKYGFSDLEYHSPVVVRQESIHHSVEVRSLAKAMNLPVSEFLALNPQFIRWATPPKAPSVTVNVPLSLGGSFSEKLASIPVTGINPDVPVYRVESGDSLWSIAHRFHIPLGKLIEANRLTTHRLKLHQKLIIPRRGTSSLTMTAFLHRKPHPHRRVSHRLIDHRVRRGDSLYFLAHHYRTSVKEILARNHLRPSQVLRVGAHIMIPSR